MKFLYILHSSSKDRYYIGSTCDLERRLSEHNRGQTKSTKQGVPWQIVFAVETPIASKLEKRLKDQKSRVVIEQLIRGDRFLAE